MGAERKQTDGFGVAMMILLCAMRGLHQVVPPFGLTIYRLNSTEIFNTICMVCLFEF